MNRLVLRRNQLAAKKAELESVKSLCETALSEAGEETDFSKVKCFEKATEDENLAAFKEHKTRAIGLQTEVDKLDAEVKELADVEADALAHKNRKTPVIHSHPDSNDPKEQPVKGRVLGLAIRSLAAAKGNAEHAVDIIDRKWKQPEMAKALSSSIGADGGFLLTEQVASEAIELLRAQSVVRASNPAIVPMDSGNLRIPKFTAGSSGGWIGENANAPKTQPAFGSVVLMAKKFASLVPVSNDLIRRASLSADQMVRDDLIADIATATDLAFIRGSGTAAQPKGIRYWAASGNVSAMSGSDDLAGITTNLSALQLALMNNNVRMIRPGWLMSARSFQRIKTIRDTNGNFAFPEMHQNPPMLWGYPVKWTTQIPNNLGGGTESEVYFADFADVVVGETTSILLDASNVAAYHDGANVVASFSQDQTVIRAIIEVDLALRHTESAAVKTGVTWGA